MRGTVLAILAAIAMAVYAPIAVAAEEAEEKAVFPEIVDAEYATEKAVDFFMSFFTAKSLHKVDETMKHFSEAKTTYIDATLGWPLYTHKALKDVFAQYMPKWPASGLSYPTRILGDENSALVAFTDTPELFGGEIRILAAIDMKDGKVIRWVDYWDGRHFGSATAAKMRTPKDKFPTDFKEKSVESAASARIRDVSQKLQAAFAGKNAEAATALFSSDAVYEDMTLRTQILGRLAIARYLKRALDQLPYGAGASVVHVVGHDLGGGYEWQAAPAFRETVRRGITALALDDDGRIIRLTTVWDGSVIADVDLHKLVLLSID